MTKKSMGYPLPPGEAFTDELACMMIFIPDKDEYRQAFFSAYFYMSNWLAWENDPDKKGKDAARAWKAAVEVTLGCIEMNICEIMVDLMTQIRDNTGIYCCDVVDISDGDRYTDVVEDGEGDVPQNIIDAGYADDAADWAGFDAYKCMIAHLMVDNMTAQLEKINSYMVEPSIILGGIPTLLAVVTTIFIDFLSALVYSVAVGASLSAQLSVALALLGKTGLESLIDEMGEHHDALACAIYNSDGVDGSVIALRVEIATLFSEARSKVLNNLNLDPQLKALYAGLYDQQDIAAIMAENGFDPGDYDCTCEFVPAPIAGYSWVIPDNAVFAHINVATLISEDYDDTTGIATLVVKTQGWQGFEWALVSPDWPVDQAPYKHAYAWKLIEYSTPTSGDCLVRYNGRIDFKADGSGDDKWYAGYNTALHSGAAWDELVAQFDVVFNHTEQFQDRIRVLQDTDLTTWTEYTFIIQLLGLQAD
jgi:hypothetical protein